MGAKQRAITPEVKQRVAERDSWDGCPCCILCGRQGEPNAHYIARSHGGLGIEENIVTLCRECHDRYDNSKDRKNLRTVIGAYLKSKYPEWDESKLTERKEQL